MVKTAWVLSSARREEMPTRSWLKYIQKKPRKLQVVNFIAAGLGSELEAKNLIVKYFIASCFLLDRLMVDKFQNRYWFRPKEGVSPQSLPELIFEWFKEYPEPVSFNDLLDFFSKSFLPKPKLKAAKEQEVRQAINTLVNKHRAVAVSNSSYKFVLPLPNVDEDEDDADDGDATATAASAEL